MSSSRTAAPLTLPPDATIADRFRVARTASRLRQSVAATALGLSLSTYQRIEDGTREPRRTEVIVFAAITGQDVEFFDAEPAAAA